MARRDHRGDEINPRQLVDAAQSIASQLLSMGDKDRKELTKQLKKDNPALHSLVQKAISDMLSRTRGNHHADD